MKYDDANYTLEKHLENICDENYQYKDLQATWEIDKKVYKSMLQGVSYNFTHYSMHDSSHSKSIISKIEMVLGPDRIQLLGATETWMILECAYSHDCGMILKNKDIEKVWESDIFQDFLKDIASGTDKDLKEAAEYILNFKKLINEDKVTKNWPVKARRFTVEIIAAYFRGKHPEKSKEYIDDFNNTWGVDLTHSGLIKPRLIKLAGDIAFLHGQGFKSVMDLEYISNGLKTDYIHPRFVAEMIRLGDLLDLDNSRFNETLIKNFGELPELSKYHLGKHGAITHILVTPQKIDVSADCKNDGEVRETRKWFDWLKDEVNNLTSNWRNIVPEDFTGTAPQIGELSILKNGQKTDVRTGNLKLEIPRKRSFEILEGAGIYKSKLDFLRELIQNALDASKIQLWRDLKNGIYDPWISKNIQLKDLTPFDIEPEVYNNYKIKVKVKYIEDKKVRITVEDRGIGINRESLIDMANVGESWNKRNNFKKELKDMPSWLKPTGGFGIGIQSCFRVTDEINIRTKTCDNNDGIKIKIESGKEEGYITSEIDKDVNFNRGSEVIVDVPQNLETNYNIRGYVAEKVKDFDPFADENEILLWIITEYIEEEFQNPLFEIELIYKDDVEKKYNSIIRNYNRFHKKNYKSTDKYLFIFDGKNLNKCYLWDKQYSASIEIELLPMDKYNRNLSETCFKGVKTISYSSRINVCGTICDINGMDTAETLTLNRKEIRQEAEIIIFNMVKKDVKFIAERYKEKIKENENLLNEKNFNTFSLKILFDIFNINDEEINEKLIDNCNEKISVLKKNESGFDRDLIDIKEVFGVNKVTLIDMVEGGYSYEDKDIDKIKDILNSKDNSKDLTCRYILIDKNLVSTIKKYYYNSNTDTIAIPNSDTGKSIKIYNYNLDIKKIFCPIKIKDSSRKNFLKKLADDHVKRKAIVLLEGYESLAVKDLPTEMWRRIFSAFSLSILRNSYFIISPITREDNKEIKNGIRKRLIEDKIKKRKDFKKLVDYVFKNRADNNRASKEDIMNDYMKLIGEYYDLIKEESKESESK